MKKLIIATISFVFICATLSFVIIPSLYNSSEIKAESSPQKNFSTYIVKISEGKIAVFEENENEPFRVTNVAVTDLPQADQNLLNRGIKVNNQNELNAILEDYCS